MTSRRQRAKAQLRNHRRTHSRGGSGDDWTLWEQLRWIPDQDSTSTTAVYALRTSILVFVVLFFALLLVDAVYVTVWIAHHPDASTAADTRRFYRFRFPWWVGLPFATVPSVTMAALGPRARTGSALEQAILTVFLL